MITRDQLENKIIRPDIDRFINQNRKAIFSNFIQNRKNGFSIIGGEKKSLSVTADVKNHGLGALYKKIPYSIELITVDIEVWIEIRHVKEPRGYIYKNLTTNKSMLEFFSYCMDYGDDTMTLNVVSDKDNDSIQVTLSSLLQKGKYIDLQELYRSKPGELFLKYQESEEE